MDLTRENLVCLICGWRWWKRLGQPDPKRCPHKDCRSKRWKDGRRGRGHAPAVPAPAAVEAPVGSVRDAILEAGEPVPERRYVPVEDL